MAERYSRNGTNTLRWAHDRHIGKQGAELVGLVVAFEEAAIRKDGQVATRGALSYRACWTPASW